MVYVWRACTICMHKYSARMQGRGLARLAPFQYLCGMLNPKTLDDLARRISGAVPAGVKDLQADLEKTLRAQLQSTLGKLDLVTREEFDVQAKVLARTRARVEELEKQVAELESRLLKPRENWDEGESDGD